MLWCTTNTIYKGYVLPQDKNKRNNNNNNNNKATMQTTTLLCEYEAVI